jgi:hypothetical protein
MFIALLPEIGVYESVGGGLVLKLGQPRCSPGRCRGRGNSVITSHHNLNYASAVCDVAAQTSDMQKLFATVRRTRISGPA